MNESTYIRPRGPLTRLLVGVLAFSIAALAQAGVPPLPTLAPPDGLGVNIHFTHAKPGELEMIRAAGFKWVRMDFTWAATEKVKGKYDFSPYDQLLADLDKHGMHALLILDYGNPLYADPGETMPITHRAGTDEFRNAYAKWAAAAVKHFAGRGCIWEIWNEPNIKNFWAPAPSAAEYVALAKAATSAIHEAAPGEPLIGPACSGINLVFLAACFQGGLLKDWSAVSVHPYRQNDPGTVAADYARLRNLIKLYEPAGKPIISSEWGYSTSWKGFDEGKQAKYLKTEFSTNIVSGIPLSIWYDWRDDGVTLDDPEHRFGLVRHDYHAGGSPVFDPKPAYDAMKEFAGEMAAGSK